MFKFNKVATTIAKYVFLGAILGTSTVATAETRKVDLSYEGLTLSANLVMADGSSLSENTILITHGTLAHNGMEIIANAQTAFAERGYNTLAISLSLGLSNRTGMYDCAVTHTHKHTDALDEIDAWMAWLKKEGAQKVSLVGHSRGGNQTAWYAAERHSAMIDKVALIAPATWSQEDEEKGYESNYDKPLAPLLAKAEALVKKGEGKSIMEGIDFIYCPNTNATAESFVSYYAPDQRMDTPSILEKIKSPVLVIAGSDDKVVKGLPEAMEKLSGNSNIGFSVIDEANHYFLDFFLEDAADLIDEFIAEG